VTLVKIQPGGSHTFEIDPPNVAYRLVGFSATNTPPSDFTTWDLYGFYSAAHYTQSSPGPFTLTQTGDGSPLSGPPPFFGTSPVMLEIAADSTADIDYWGGDFLGYTGLSQLFFSDYYFPALQVTSSPDPRDADSAIQASFPLAVVTDFSVAATASTINAGDSVTLTVTLAKAAPSHVRFCVTLTAPSVITSDGTTSTMTPVTSSSFIVVGAGLTTGSITFSSSAFGPGAIGATTTVYVVPSDNSVFAGSIFVVDEYRTAAITILTPTPPPFNPGGPGGPYYAFSFALAGTIGLTTGGGNPRLYAIVARAYSQIGSSPLNVVSTAVRCVSSPDFGETFLPGVDIGAKDSSGTAITDNSALEILTPLVLSVMPSGTLWVNGSSYSVSLGRTYWQAGMRSTNGGRTWTTASMSNSHTVTGPSNGTTTSYYAASLPGVADGTLNQNGFWVSRGGYEGTKGAGGQAGGAYRVLKACAPTTGGHPGVAETLDDGDTWTMPTDMPTSPIYSLMAPVTQPIAWRGGSTDGIWYSTDDYQTISGIHVLIDSTFGGSFKSVMSADNDVLYRITTRSYAGIRQLVFLVNRNAVGRYYSLNGTKQVPVWWSSSKDGANLLPVMVPDLNALLVWQWKGKIVIMAQDQYDQSVIQCYVSDNEGQWFRKTVHSADAGMTWFPD